MITLITLYRWGKNWRWRMHDKHSGNVIGASTEGYRKRIDALKNLNRVTRARLPKGRVFAARPGSTQREFHWTVR